MDVVEGVDALRAEHGRLFVVIGVFDGLHLGHVYLLEHLRSEAERHAARPTVITFDHHPDEVIRGAAPPFLLNPGERLELLAAAGVQVAVVQHFDDRVRHTPYDAFVHRIGSRVDLAGFLMTPDAAFGFERRGTPETVAALGARDGFDVVVVPQVNTDGQTISSSEIRRLIADGDLAGASGLLGRPYAVVGDGSPIDAGGTLVRFEMPVALPPAGAYPATVEGGGGAQAGEAVVHEDGQLTLPGTRADGTLRVVFSSGRLPRFGPPATIRRS